MTPGGRRRGGRTALALAAFWLVPQPALPCSPDDFARPRPPAAVRSSTTDLAPATLAAAGAWETRAPMPEAVQEVAVAALEGEVFVVGGFRSDASINDGVWRYDPQTDTWAAAPALPTPIHHTTATVVDGRLYVIGGWADIFQTPLDDVWEYDPQTGQWTAKSPMPTPRGSPAAAVLDGRIYVAGGWPLARAQDFAVYDPATDQWQPLPDLPTGRNHLGLAAAGGRILAVGGRTDIFAGVGNVDSVEAYDPQLGVWTTRASLPRARGGIAVTSFGPWVFAFGGEGNAAHPDGVFEDADAYDTRADAWTALDPMPTPRHGIGAAVVAGSVHLPGGGPVQNFGTTDVHEVLDVAEALALSIPAGDAVLGIGLAAALLLYGIGTTGGASRRSAGRGSGRLRQ